MLLLRGGDVVDQNGRRRADVLIDGPRIAAVGADVPAPAGATVLDATDAVVCPAFVDLHTHLRQPGQEEAETVETGSRAAALGGYGAVVAMPNTTPATDCVEVVRQVRRWGEQAGLVDVHPAAAITAGRAGTALADLAALHADGVRIFTDDGNEVADAALMRAALEAIRDLPGAVLAQHAECAALVAHGHLNEGPVCRALGLGGRPAVAEEITVARDLALVRLVGGGVRYHVLHASVAATVELLRRARADGLAVTMEVTPQHLTLTEACCSGADPNFKVNPPLRTDADLAVLRHALRSGEIDAVATDHAPHAPDTKARPFAAAPPGMLGLETALAVLLGPAEIPLEVAVAALSWRPAAIAGLADHGRPVAPGEPANLCVFDPAARWQVDPAALASKSRNTPFTGLDLRGRVRHTLLRGEPTVTDGVATR
ncbi:MAG: dihydroorotase [Acidimicrobiales bacterium]